MDNETIHLYTDGSCEPNPGDMGIGILLRYKNHERHISRFLGDGTNNIAELEAIRQGLLELKTKEKPVIIYTDSQYCIGVLYQGWKANKNTKLVSYIKDLLKEFKTLSFVKVKAHDTNVANNLTDELALKACTTKVSSEIRRTI